jgi:hypothetical protein
MYGIENAVCRDWHATLVYHDLDIRFSRSKRTNIKNFSQHEVGLIVSFDQDKLVEILQDAWECENGHIIRARGPILRTTCNYMSTASTFSVRGRRHPCGAKLTNQLFSEQKRTDVFSVRVEEVEDDPNRQALTSFLREL